MVGRKEYQDIETLDDPAAAISRILESFGDIRQRAIERGIFTHDRGLVQSPANRPGTELTFLLVGVENDGRITEALTPPQHEGSLA